MIGNSRPPLEFGGYQTRQSLEIHSRLALDAQATYDDVNRRFPVQPRASLPLGHVREYRGPSATPSVGGPLRVRIGIPPVAIHESGDYHGSAVNRCAHLMGIAHGEQVLISEATYALVCDGPPPGPHRVGNHTTCPSPTPSTESLRHLCRSPSTAPSVSLTEAVHP